MSKHETANFEREAVSLFSVLVNLFCIIFIHCIFSVGKISSFCIFWVGFRLGKMQNVLMSVGKKGWAKKE